MSDNIEWTERSVKICNSYAEAKEALSAALPMMEKLTELAFQRKLDTGFEEVRGARTRKVNVVEVVETTVPLLYRKGCGYIEMTTQTLITATTTKR